MSHHRHTITAVGAPQAAGPYSHAVKSGGLIFLSGQTPIDPGTGSLVEGGIGAQTKRCLDNLGIVAAAAGASLADAVRCGTSATISTACAWWPIIPCMNLMSAPVYCTCERSLACAAVMTWLACPGAPGWTIGGADDGVRTPRSGAPVRQAPLTATATKMAAIR